MAKRTPGVVLAVKLLLAQEAVKALDGLIAPEMAIVWFMGARFPDLQALKQTLNLHILQAEMDDYSRMG